MKLKKYISIITIAILIFCSCSKELDLAPITERNASSFYATESELESAISGAYARLQNNGLYGLDLIGVGEISGQDSFEEIPANDGGRFGQLDDFSTNAGNDLVGDIWRESYKAIQNTNTVLERIEEISYADESLKTRRIGEMQFVRALVYFNLVRLYGAVPLVLIETTNPFDYFGQGRTAVSEVYAQIEIDLLNAIQNLPVSKQSGRPARGAAQALLGEVYLTLGNFSEALIYLGDVVNSGQYSLQPSTSQIFGVANEGNPEILFEIQFASGLNGNSEGASTASQFRPSGTTSNAKGHNLPGQEFINSYDVNDTRLHDYYGFEPALNPYHFTTKYEVSSTGANDGGSDHIIIRYADVLLEYAEALNETGATVQAIIELNKVRSRANLSATNATTQTEVREAIRLERRFELMGEGRHWFDLKRYGNAVTTMNAFFANNGINISIDETKLLLPIPQSQIDTDPGVITQNPGY